MAQLFDCFEGKINVCDLLKPHATPRYTHESQRPESHIGLYVQLGALPTIADSHERIKSMGYKPTTVGIRAYCVFFGYRRLKVLTRN